MATPISMSHTETRPRPFRLPASTLRLLDRRAAARGKSANRLARRLLDEALRTDEHPLIFFPERPSGEREPALIGTRLRVAQVIQTLRASHAEIAADAEFARTAGASA
jgi:hypothetical protein